MSDLKEKKEEDLENIVEEIEEPNQSIKQENIKGDVKAENIEVKDEPKK